MHNTKVQKFAIALVACIAVTACNSDPIEYSGETIDYGGVAITAFSLNKDSQVLNNLDSVFFSIDLESARIFNANPLPEGTKINELAMTITSDPCSKMIVHNPTGDGGFEDIEYSENKSKKFNFAEGPLKLTLTSYDGQTTRDYYIEVNVNVFSPDSLYWARVDCTELPSAFTAPTAQRTVKFSGKAWCLTTNGTSYSIYHNADPYSESWVGSTIDFPEAVDVRSLTATLSKLYLLTMSGKLLSSSDGVNWADTGLVWRSISAPYGDKLLGVAMVGANLCHTTYPSDGSQQEVIADNFPVSGISAPIECNSKWSSSPQIIIAGGRTAEGQPSRATWSYDGSNWGCLSTKLKAMEGVALAKYTICETDTNTWRTKESEVILAIGGLMADGYVNPDVYYSRDYGMNWQKALPMLQLPNYMPWVYNADLICLDATLGGDAPSASASSIWRTMPVATPLARAIKPIETWECPYLYLFGGEQSSGDLSTKVWRGVINRYTAKPLQ